MSELSPKAQRILEVLLYLNPRLEEDWDAAPRYAQTINAEAEENRLPTARRVMAEALRWKP